MPVRWTQLKWPIGMVSILGFQDTTAVTIGDGCDTVSDGLLNANEPFICNFSCSLLSQGRAGSGKCHFHYQGKEPLLIWNEKRNVSLRQWDRVAHVIPFRCGCTNMVNELETNLKPQNLLFHSQMLKTTGTSSVLPIFMVCLNVVALKNYPL